MLNPAAPEFWVFVAFVLFMGLLAYYKVFQAIGRALDDRAEAIRSELDDARRLREEAQKLLADYKRKSLEAEEEAKEIIEQARREAEALASETRKSLADQLERRSKLAEEKIARAEAQALGEVRSTAVDVALDAAERILKQRVAGATGASLIEASINDVKKRLN